MTLDPSCTIEDVAFIVGSTLDAAGIVAVLSGGGAATIYAPEAKKTEDLDFILALSMTDSMPSDAPILGLGFEREGRSGMYRHPNIRITLEFPTGPLAVGGEVIEKWETLRRGPMVLNVISPTDCVKDRMAAAIHWKDFDSIRQASEVAKRHPVDLDAVRKWCEAEGGLRQFEALRQSISG